MATVNSPSNSRRNNDSSTFRKVSTRSKLETKRTGGLSSKNKLDSRTNLSRKSLDSGDEEGLPDSL